MIQLDIGPEVERRVVEAARARGLEPAVYAGQIVAEAVEYMDAYTSPKNPTHEEFKTSLDRLARYADKIPDLPDDAYSRESICQGHD